MENKEEVESMADYYVRMDLALFSDLRVKKAARKTGHSENEVLGALARLWAHAFNHCPDGIFWELEAEDFCAAMGVLDFAFVETLLEVGLLARNAEGVIFCDGWDRHTGEILKKNKKKTEQNARRQAAFRERRAEKVTLDPALRNAPVTLDPALRNAQKNVSNAKVTLLREENRKEENTKEKKKTGIASAHTHERAHEANSVGERPSALDGAGAPPDSFFECDAGTELLEQATRVCELAVAAPVPSDRPTSTKRSLYSPADEALARDWVAWATETHPHLRIALKTAAKDIRLAREHCQRTTEQMRNVFEWIKQDDFWSKNCLSPCALNTKSKANGLRKIDNILNSISKDTRTMQRMQSKQWEDEGIKPLF